MVYLDTSAFVPLLIEEPASETSRLLWDESGSVYSTRLLCVEAVSALTRRGFANADELVEPWFRRMRVIELDRTLMAAAVTVARSCCLRGYDAVHCAAAVSIAGPELVAASSDRELLDSWNSLGVNTCDPARGHASGA